jgi:hypothetical protein
MIEDLIIKKYELSERLSLLNDEWDELEQDLCLVKQEHWEILQQLEQVEQEIKEETNV